MSNARPFRRALRSVVALGLGAGLLAGCSSDSDSDSGTEAAAEGGGDCSSLEGEDITLVVPYEPGGGYDSYARLVAPYLEDAVGATVVVQNNPGAGGLLALNSLLTADADGTQLAIMNGVGSGGSSIAGAQGASFSLDDFTYIGRVASDPSVIVTSAEGPYQSFEDVQAADGFRWGSTGPGAEDYINTSLLSSVFDIDAEVVTGFPGSGETELAVLQGSIDGMSGNLTSRRSAIEDGSQTPVLVMGEESPDWLPEDVPLVTELEMTDEQSEIVDAHLALIEVGRPFIGPPDMDQDATTCLRDAMATAMEDPALIKESEEQERELAFLPGADYDELLQRIDDAPAAYTELLTSLY